MKLVHENQVSSLKIGQLADVEVPRFAVITGVNGSGKTQLLQGLSQGSIWIDELHVPTEDIRSIEAGQLMPSGPDAIISAEYRDSWTPIFESLTSHRNVPPDVWAEISATEDLLRGDERAIGAVHDGVLPSKRHAN